MFSDSLLRTGKHGLTCIFEERQVLWLVLMHCDFQVLACRVWCRCVGQNRQQWGKDKPSSSELEIE